MFSTKSHSKTLELILGHIATISLAAFPVWVGTLTAGVRF